MSSPSGKTNDRECGIGQRLKQFRCAIRWSQAKLAKQIGLTRDQLSNIEYGRTPLKYRVFSLISQRHRLNPYWLAEQRGEMALPKPFPDSGFITSVTPDALFSEVFDRLIFPSDPILRQLVESHLATAVNDFDDFLAMIRDISLPLDLRQSVADNARSRLEETMRELAGQRRVFGIKKEVPEKQERERKELLDTLFPNEDKGDVQNKFRTFGELLDHLRKITEPHGAKAALAKDFKVTRQAVDQWLSGDAKPSAELCIQLQWWKPPQPAK